MTNVNTMRIIVKKKLAVYNAFRGRHPRTRKSKTANITKDYITLQHIAKMSLSFVIFAVLDLRVGGCRP